MKTFLEYLAIVVIGVPALVLYGWGMGQFALALGLGEPVAVTVGFLSFLVAMLLGVIAASHEEKGSEQ